MKTRSLERAFQSMVVFSPAQNRSDNLQRGRRTHIAHCADFLRLQKIKELGRTLKWVFFKLGKAIFQRFCLLKTRSQDNFNGPIQKINFIVNFEKNALFLKPAVFPLLENGKVPKNHGRIVSIFSGHKDWWPLFSHSDLHAKFQPNPTGAIREIAQTFF